MQIYKVVVKKDCSKPIFILVNSSAGIWRTYRRFYPDSADSVSAELLNGEILVDEDVFEEWKIKKGKHYMKNI